MSPDLNFFELLPETNSVVTADMASVSQNAEVPKPQIWWFKSSNGVCKQFIPSLKLLYFGKGSQIIFGSYSVLHFCFGSCPTGTWTDTMRGSAHGQGKSLSPPACHMWGEVVASLAPTLVKLTKFFFFLVLKCCFQPPWVILRLSKEARFPTKPCWSNLAT